MRPRPFARRLLPLLLLLCLGPAAAVRADDGHPGEASAEERKSAALMLHVDEQGRAHVTLSTAARADDPGLFVRALSESLGFPLTVDRAYPASGEESEEGAAEAGGDEEGDRDWLFVGAHNERAFASDGWLTAGRLDPRPLLRALGTLGVEELTVHVTFRGEVKNLRVTGAEKFSMPEGYETLRDRLGEQFAYALYNASFATEAAERAAPVEFSWGYRRSDVLRQSSPLLAFLLLPPLLTIWVCRRATRAKAAGPEAIWGRYFLYLYRLLNVIWLVWLPVHSWVAPNELLSLFAGGSPGFAVQAAGVVFFFAPPFAAVWLCHLLSSGVYRRVGGAEWDARAVVRRTLLLNAAMFSPFMLGMLAFETFAARSPYAGPMMLVALVGGMALLQLAGKAFNASAYALTHGPLRDRVNALAAAAGVSLKEILILPDSPAQLSNAYARSDNAVLITSSLLRHLSRREVDAVLAHELGHLKAGHPQALGRVNIVAIVAANFLAFALSSSFDAGSLTPLFIPLSFLAATLVTFFLSRGYERHADSVAVNLTRDPEACITGHVRLSRLNLMPLDGATWGDVLNTHPATMERLRDIAGCGGITPERFEQLLASARVAHPAAELYEAHAAPAGKVFSADFRSGRAMRLMWAIFATVVVPPTLLALLLQQFQPGWGAYWAALPAGVALAFALHLFAVNSLSLRAFAKANARLRERLGARAGGDAICVGLAPAAEPYYYELLSFWDAGLLRLEGDLLRYDGEEARVVLRRDQVREVYAAAAHPTWFRQRYVYLNWHDPESGRAGTFYLVPLEARTLTGGRRQSALLHERLKQWLAAAPSAAAATSADVRATSTDAPAAPADAPDAPAHALPPACDAVTGQPMSAVVNRRAFVRSLFLFPILSFVFSVGLRLPFWGVVYAFLLVLSVTLLDHLPALRERPTKGRAPQAPRAADPDPAPAYTRGSWAESET